MSTTVIAAPSAPDLSHELSPKAARWVIASTVIASLAALQLGAGYFRLQTQQQQVSQAWQMVIARVEERNRLIETGLQALQPAAYSSLESDVDRFRATVAQLHANVDVMLYTRDPFLMRTYGGSQHSVEITAQRLVSKLGSPALTAELSASSDALREAEDRYEIAARIHNSVWSAYPQRLVAWALRIPATPTFNEAAPSYRKMAPAGT